MAATFSPKVFKHLAMPSILCFQHGRIYGLDLLTVEAVNSFTRFIHSFRQLHRSI